MAIRFRHYLFEESGVIKRVPRRVCDALTFGEDAIPEYAGTKQRVAQVVVENEDGKPVRILDARGSYWTFDKEGRIDQALMESAGQAMEFAFRAPTNTRGKVVDLRPEIKRKQWQDATRWDLTAEDLERIAADLWPGLADASDIKTVKGKAQKKPPLTREASKAIDEIHGKIAAIAQEIKDLSEPALKGFAFEASRLAKAYSDERHLWTAMAEEANKQREIKARHRTGKGMFYAVLHVWYADSPTHSTEVDTVEVRCDGKNAAIEAARRLLAENAHRFSEDITIEAEILSEQEWSSVDDEQHDEDEGATGADSV
jgi:hypothetical protein